MWVPPCQVPEFFDEQIRKNRLEIYQQRQGEKLLFRLYIKTVIISSHPIHLWCIHLRKCHHFEDARWDQLRWMRCWIFFPNIMDYVWKLIILASSRIVKTWAKQPDKKDETPPRTIQWTFSIQSDATIKQISRRPALKWPINTINLWRCGCETGCAFWLWLWTSFSMSKDFWYTVYTYL